MDIINHIIDHSKKESELDGLKKTLEQNAEKIRGNAQHLVQALGNLEADKHTLGMIYILHAKSQQSKVDQAFIAHAERLFVNLNRNQAKRAADKLAAVAHRYTEACREAHIYDRCITCLTIAVQRFRPSPEYLTPMHADILCICLKAKNFKAGEQLLRQKIFEIDPVSTGLTPRDLMLYYYYGGMIFAGLKKFSAALQCFDTVLQTPAFGLSSIMVESFKKLVLVSLLVHGKFLGITKHASPVVSRHIKSYATMYIDLANAYAAGDIDKVLAVANDKGADLQKDGNFGLVKQCIRALRRRAIQKLTETYMTLSLADIAKQAKLESVQEAEAELLKMIANGEINARINQKDGMVKFEEDQQNFSSPLAGQQLESGIARAMQLAQKLQNVQDNIASSQQYIARLHGVRDDALDIDSPHGAGGRHGAPRGKMSKMFDFFGGGSGRQ